MPKQALGAFGLIYRLSYPKVDLVNDVIAPSLCFVKYPTFDSVVDRVAVLGQGDMLAKCDLKCFC